jgi:hypothetical protein
MDFSHLTLADLPALLARMPKAELHIHIEGSLEPELIFELAKKNGVALAYPSVEALLAAYAFTDLQSFLDLYYAGASVLITEDDFYARAMAYFARAHADHVVHAELFFDPQTHTERGVSMGAVIGGLARACADAQSQYAISASLILCFLRHLSEASAIETLQAALPYRQHFIGVGLDSGERGNPPEKFATVFAQCRALGLHDLALVGGGFRGGIDLAEREARHLAVQGLRHVRGGIGGAEMHGMAAPGQDDGDGGGNGGLAHPTFAHGHDHPDALLLDGGHEGFEIFHFGCGPSVFIRLHTPVWDVAAKQHTQTADAEDVDGAQRHDKARHGTDEMTRRSQGR